MKSKSWCVAVVVLVAQTTAFAQNRQVNSPRPSSAQTQALIQQQIRTRISQPGKPLAATSINGQSGNARLRHRSAWSQRGLPGQQRTPATPRSGFGTATKTSNVAASQSVKSAATKNPNTANTNVTAAIPAIEVATRPTSDVRPIATPTDSQAKKPATTVTGQATALRTSVSLKELGQPAVVADKPWYTIRSKPMRGSLPAANNLQPFVTPITPSGHFGMDTQMPKSWPLKSPVQRPVGQQPTDTDAIETVVEVDVDSDLAADVEYPEPVADDAFQTLNVTSEFPELPQSTNLTPALKPTIDSTVELEQQSVDSPEQVSPTFASERMFEERRTETQTGQDRSNIPASEFQSITEAYTDDWDVYEDRTTDGSVSATTTSVTAEANASTDRLDASIATESVEATQSRDDAFSAPDDINSLPLPDANSVIRLDSEVGETKVSDPVDVVFPSETELPRQRTRTVLTRTEATETPGDYPPESDSDEYAATADRLVGSIRQPADPNSVKMVSNWPIRQLTLMDAVHLAIENSPQMDILRSDVSIQQAEVARQAAAFDWLGFIETEWNDVSIPVGNDLLGVENRFRDDRFSLQAGLRRRNTLGGNVRVGRDTGFQDSNSEFFNPRHQATAGIVLEYNQPLLRGAGREVNRSLIEIALSDRDAIEGDFMAGLQDYILDVARAYLALAEARARLNILNTSALRARDVVALVEKGNASSVGVQTARAEASTAVRDSDLINAGVNVLQRQESLLQLLYGSRFQEHANREVVPIDVWRCEQQSILPESQVQIALQYRPEIPAAVQRIRIAAIEKGLAANQMLPLLGLSLSVSNQGLRGDNDIGGAYRDKWSKGKPSYSVGLQFEQAIGRRAAKAGLRQSEWAMHRLQKEFETVIAEVTLEVRNATHRANAAARNYQLKDNALRMAVRELSLVKQRSELMTDKNDSRRLYLNDLLQTQDRLAAAELDTVSALIECVIAQFDVDRASGSLLRRTNDMTEHSTPIQFESDPDVGLPFASGY